MKRFGIVSIALVAATAALAADQPARQGLNGHYFLYSGDIGDWQAATPKDTKVFLEIEGAAAQGIYNALGKALDQPTEDDNVTSRERGDISCTFDKSAKPAAAYGCYAGYDLKTGKSINSTVE